MLHSLKRNLGRLPTENSDENIMYRHMAGPKVADGSDEAVRLA